MGHTWMSIDELAPSELGMSSSTSTSPVRATGSPMVASSGVEATMLQIESTPVPVAESDRVLLLIPSTP